MKRCIAATLLCLGVAFSACSRNPFRRTEVPVFIVSIDTLRSDHLPVYGYGRGSTPAISAFRKEAVLFERAFSHTPQTLPSHATILTGLLPASTGVRDNIGYVLPSNIQTLASTLKTHGYETGAAVSSYVLRRSTGIASGFDFFDDSLDLETMDRPTSAERDGGETLDALEKWLSGHDPKKNRKLFGFLHLYEPHAPYRPPVEFASAATPYDGEISHADAIFGRFMAELKQQGLYDDALIIVLSDHGEGLGEHGEDEHGIFVYRASLQVPLLVKLPRGKRGGESVAAPVGLADVVPTILAQLGIEANRLDGVDALQSSLPARAIYAETFFPRLHLGWSELTSLIDQRFHYISAPSSELYEYGTDQGEVHNRLQEERRVGAAMKGALERMVKPLAPPTAVDPEDQRKLAALGYIGSTVGSGTALPDPKEKIGSVRLFRDALDAFNHGDDARAQQLLLQLTSETPTFSDGWGLLAQSYRRQGKDAAAVDALKNAMSRFPNDSHVALALADALYAVGRHDEARAHAELALHDNAVLAHEALATFALRERNPQLALREAEAALKEAPTRTTTLLLAASAYEEAQSFDKVVSTLDQALTSFEQRKSRPPRGTHARKARALLQLQRVAEAEASFRSELQNYPDDRRTWGELALIVAAQGRRDAAAAILQQALAMNRDAEMLRIAEESAEVMGDPRLRQQLRQMGQPR
jgi:tetratricopeptide (TPR) repeat protein